MTSVKGVLLGNVQDKLYCREWCMTTLEAQAFLIGRHRSSICFPIYTRSRISQSPVPHNVISPLRLLPPSRSLYRRRPHVIHRPQLVQRQSLQCGAVLLPSSRAHGSLFIPTSRVQRCERRIVLFKDGYGTHCFHSPSIVCRCLFVRYWCPSMC